MEGEGVSGEDEGLGLWPVPEWLLLNLDTCFPGGPYGRCDTTDAAGGPFECQLNFKDNSRSGFIVHGVCAI